MARRSPDVAVEALQGTTLRDRTPPGSVGALDPQATLSYQMQAWAASWATTRPCGVGLPNNGRVSQFNGCGAWSIALASV
jgi:hypothetical protein